MVDTIEGCKHKHAIDAQNTFRRTIRNTELFGMMVNTGKTNLLCVSDSLSYKACAHLYSVEGAKLSTENSTELKLLGFRFGSRPTCQTHIDAMRRSFRGRYWLLIHMKQHFYTEEELIKAYKSLVRHIAEYCSVVLHSMLTDRQGDEIEKLQVTALRCVYGYGIPYARMREMSGLDTLRQRRIDATDKFATKCAAGERFAHWFPRMSSRQSARNPQKYREDYARCERL